MEVRSDECDGNTSCMPSVTCPHKTTLSQGMRQGSPGGHRENNYTANLAHDEILVGQCCQTCLTSSGATTTTVRLSTGSFPTQLKSDRTRTARETCTAKGGREEEQGIIRARSSHHRSSCSRHSRRLPPSSRGSASPWRLLLLHARGRKKKGGE